MNEHQSFVSSLSNTVIQALDCGNGDPAHVRRVMLHSIYGYVAMKLPTRVSFTVINQACQDTDVYDYGSLSGRILSIIERLINFDPVQANVVDKIVHKDPLAGAIERIMDESLTYKFKTPPAGSLELDKLYDYAFDELHASWCGRIGHYAYADENPSGEANPLEVAERQDGFIYCYCRHNRWYITADITAAFIDRANVVEITL